ncbi:MAG: FG-GAP-like repeat-containing protein [Fidelibacterota bacterium]
MNAIIFIGIITLFTAVNGQIYFTNLTSEAGMNYNISGEGVCIFDFDNDDLEDVFVCDRNNGSNLLFHNLGSMEFEEVSFAVGITTSAETRLPLAADYNNDGYLDLFIGAMKGNSFLYRNNGDGTFSDVTVRSGIVTNGGLEGGAWNDVNNDGWIDLYVGRLTEFNYFFKNNGDGTFTDFAQNINAAGPQNGGLVMGLGFFDYDNDGDDDLFLTQDNNRGNILLRKEESGVFSDISASAGVILPVMGMGVALGDYNRDGWIDVYTSNLYENSLLQNSPQGYFYDVADLTGVSDIPGSMAWGTFFFDADNDGWLDIFNNNQSGFGDVPNSFFRNLQNGSFEDLSQSSGLQSYNNGIGCAYGDLDNDGDLDIIAAGHSYSDGSVLLYRNDSPSNNWVQFLLQSNEGDPFAIGAKIIIYTQSGSQFSQVAAGNGYCSQNTLRQHFGLGDEIDIDSVVVNWPDGEREFFDVSETNQRYLLVKGSGNVFPLTIKSDIIPIEHNIISLYPNPFNPETTIRIKVENADKHPLRLDIYNIKGKWIDTLINQKVDKGEHDFVWNASQFPSGIYFIRYQSQNRIFVVKGVLTK